MKVSKLDLLVYRLFYWRWAKILAQDYAWDYAWFSLFKHYMDEYEKNFDKDGNPKP